MTDQRVGEHRAALSRRIRRLLRFNHEVRDPVRDSRNRLPMLPVLQRWQAGRLATSFDALLADPASAPAARFFLSDLYGDHDVSGRDRDVERVMPLMQRLLPATMLAIAADAIELAVLSHALDLRMAEFLEAEGQGEDIDAARYGRAWRRTGLHHLRRRQIRLIDAVGQGLARVVHTPAVAQLLRLARLPARAAGLSELQSFLERGFSSFGALPDASAFVDGIVEREQRVMERLFAADPDPFRD